MILIGRIESDIRLLTVSIDILIEVQFSIVVLAR